MPCSMSTAHNQVLTILATVLTGFAVKWPDRPPLTTPFPPTNAPWIRVGIEDTGQGRLPPLVAERGSRRYTTDGILTVELFTLAGDGRRASQTLGEAVLAAFRGNRTEGGVWFRRERVKPVGPDGVWWHENAIVEFQYDSIGG